MAINSRKNREDFLNKIRVELRGLQVCEISLSRRRSTFFPGIILVVGGATLLLKRVVCIIHACAGGWVVFHFRPLGALSKLKIHLTGLAFPR